MPFADLFKTYPNRNAELRAIAMTCYEFGRPLPGCRARRSRPGSICTP
jgi:hypothetical protein